jgi:hypothetical protein
MELKRLEVYQKEYRESSSATIEKADAKYKEIYSAECTRSVASGQAIEFLKKSPWWQSTTAREIRAKLAPTSFPAHGSARSASAEDSAHLLEAHGAFAASLLAGIGDEREMRRAYFHPLCLAGKGRR